LSGIKILHTADLHIGANVSFLGERSMSRRIEAVMTFERIVSLAKENGVEAVLIAGDLLDFNKIETSFAERILDTVKTASEIKFYYSAGNHDPLNFDSPFLKNSLPENFYVFPTKDTCFEVKEGVKIYGRSFSEILENGEDKFSIVPDENDINIMCIHGEYGYASGRNPISDGFVIESGMDYIALGHIHARTTPQKIGNTYIAYCGCPEGLGFDELGEKGVYIGTIDKNTCDLRFVPVCKRMHISESVDVTDLSDTIEIFKLVKQTLSQKYGENYGENLYKIVLVGEISENTEINTFEIAERLKENCYFAKVYDKTSVKFNLDELKNEVSVKGEFIRRMLEKAENEPHNKDKIMYALKIGLKAFSGEVEYNENN